MSDKKEFIRLSVILAKLDSILIVFFTYFSPSILVTNLFSVFFHLLLFILKT